MNEQLFNPWGKPMIEHTLGRVRVSWVEQERVEIDLGHREVLTINVNDDSIELYLPNFAYLKITSGNVIQIKSALVDQRLQEAENDEAS